MSALKGAKCDTCGIQGHSSLLDYMPPSTWYTLYPPNSDTRHFCSAKCLGEWLDHPVNIIPRPWWRRILGI